MKILTKTVAVASIFAGAIAFGGAAQAAPMVTLTFPESPDLFPQGYKATRITYNNDDTSKSA